MSPSRRRVVRWWRCRILRSGSWAIEPTERGFLAGLGHAVGGEVSDQPRLAVEPAGGPPWAPCSGPWRWTNLGREDASSLLRRQASRAQTRSGSTGWPAVTRCRWSWRLPAAGGAWRRSEGLHRHRLDRRAHPALPRRVGRADAPTPGGGRRRAPPHAVPSGRHVAGDCCAGCLRTHLPFVEVGSDGLVLHDTVREIVAAFLRSSDPERSRCYRVAAWRQLRRELARASPQEMWRYTADLLFILENPMIREAFFPTSRHLYYVDAAQPGDWPAIEELARGEKPPTSGAILAQWWRTLPSAFRTARSQSGEVVGCSVVSELEQLSAQLLQHDPMARRCRDDLRRHRCPEVSERCSNASKSLPVPRTPCRWSRRRSCWT